MILAPLRARLLWLVARLPLWRATNLPRPFWRLRATDMDNRYGQ